jgi:hypothetical protein
MAGNINSSGDFWKAMGIGALSGLAGYGAGSLVSGAIGTVGVVGGAATGATGGFAGGFVAGAGNAWAGGSNFTDGINFGLRGGGWGALTGSVIGGVAGGITAYWHGGNIFTGEGAVFESVSAAPADPSKPITVGEGMEYSNKYAQDFSDTHFGKNVKGVTNLYADGTMPKGYRTVGDYVQNIKTKEFVGGLTKHLGLRKGSNVYLFKNGFTSPEKLYLTMGHEYIHAAFNNLGHGNLDGKKQDAVAYDWNMRQSRMWGLSGYEKVATEYAGYNRGMYPYRLSRIGDDFMKLISKPKWYLIK